MIISVWRGIVLTWLVILTVAVLSHRTWIEAAHETWFADDEVRCQSYADFMVGGVSGQHGGLLIHWYEIVARSTNQDRPL